MSLLGPPAYERGSGCTGSQRIDCFLDYIPNGASTKVSLAVKVSGSGGQTIKATASSDRDNNTADNTASLNLQIGSAAPPVVSPPARTPTGAKGMTKIGTAKANTFVGSNLADILKGLGGNDILTGKAGPDKLYGGPGNDTLTGGPGTDLLDGGPGNDTINARDGQRDTIRCGTGKDTVTADKNDAVDRDCETIKRA